jgi:hypothetical protein
LECDPYLDLSIFAVYSPDVAQVTVGRNRQENGMTCIRVMRNGLLLFRLAAPPVVNTPRTSIFLLLFSAVFCYKPNVIRAYQTRFAHLNDLA